jgi:ubiquinone/menaquinone biosynthesis C-methylase UbiE
LTSPFDATARSFDRDRALPNGVAETLRSAILGALASGRNAAARSEKPRLLDLGAGTGRIGCPFVATCDDYIGVDLSYGMLRAFASRCGCGQLSPLVQADGCALPFANAAFDAVMLMQIFGGLQDWRRLIDEARRVLRPHGALMLGRTVRPNDGVDARMRQNLVRQLGSRFERQNTHEDAERHLTAIACSATHLVGAIWRAERSPRAFLDRHATAARFSQLPQGHREDALRTLAVWAEKEFGGLDAMFPETHRFELRVFRFSGE